MGILVSMNRSKSKVKTKLFLRDVLQMGNSNSMLSRVNDWAFNAFLAVVAENA
jgi:hypothetical protein